VKVMGAVGEVVQRERRVVVWTACGSLTTKSPTLAENFGDVPCCSSSSISTVSASRKAALSRDTVDVESNLQSLQDRGCVSVSIERE
jgi:hypothetical protein